MSKKIVNFLAVAAIGLTIQVPASAQELPDGIVEAAPPPVAAIVPAPACVLKDGGCPQFPAGQAFNRADIAAAIEHELSCSDSHQHSARDERLDSLKQNIPAEVLANAVANVMLTAQDLSLHEVKISVDMLGEVDSPRAVAHLNTVYNHAEALADRAVRAGNIQHFSDKELAEFVARQANDIRRQVVLALTGSDQPGAADLLNEAASHSERSVAMTATQALSGVR